MGPEREQPQREAARAELCAERGASGGVGVPASGQFLGVSFRDSYCQEVLIMAGIRKRNSTNQEFANHKNPDLVCHGISIFLKSFKSKKQISIWKKVKPVRMMHRKVQMFSDLE
ncbi:hypothetical protein NDU88_001392 [Pleurodeles waltl]|uniref:Uncharacterized protein n=1 Tax=Pleurodeles waltl TaxID=8319 RepID=A0AAV7LZF9_PLEWA|nr:hypothetical protein NDU88_001392 [Pleurodeles waltl]